MCEESRQLMMEQQQSQAKVCSCGLSARRLGQLPHCGSRESVHAVDSIVVH